MNSALVSDDADEKLHFPWHVIEAACASLNSGKHLILTGPPGCGKSKLAIALAGLADKNPLVGTASPAWTTGELIGRYMPARGDEHEKGDSLVFEPGLFLKAVEQDSWLIIDEINRSDIDKCFGELFSVLAGDMVTLPFKKRVSEDHETEDGHTAKMSHVRIIPEAKGEETEAAGADYAVPDSFRLIGTMNDADRSRLSQLSFALQRRFDTIRVDAPRTEVRQKIIEDRLQKVVQENELNFDKYAYRIRVKGKNRYTVKLDHVKRALKSMFAADGSKAADLISLRIVGVATAVDVIEFVAEGLRSSYADDEKRTIKVKGGKHKGSSDAAKDLAHSYLALGTVLSVYPQLDAIATEGDKLTAAAQSIFAPFDGRHMCRISPAHAGESGGIARLGEENLVMTIDQTIKEFLWDELENNFRDQPSVLNPVREHFSGCRFIREDE